MLPSNFHNKVLNIAEYHEKIVRYKSECGCKMGAIFTVMTFISLIGYSLITILDNPIVINDFPYLIKNGVYGLGIIIISAGMGKLTGKAIARIKLRRIYKVLGRIDHLKKNNYVNMY